MCYRRVNTNPHLPRSAESPDVAEVAGHWVAESMYVYQESPPRAYVVDRTLTQQSPGNTVGAIALSIEYVIGQLIPLFVLEYAGYDQSLISEVLTRPPPAPQNSRANNNSSSSPLEDLASLGGPPISHVALLATLPMVVSGVASFALVPLSIAVGRRPVMLLCGAAAWAGGFWAGASRGLGSHLAARCLQGLGSGVVDALVPLVVQDLTFIHQRSRAIAAVSSAVGVVSVCLNVARCVCVCVCVCLPPYIRTWL
jgi:MFS family permease